MSVILSIKNTAGAPIGAPAPFPYCSLHFFKRGGGTQRVTEGFALKITTSFYFKYCLKKLSILSKGMTSFRS